MEVQKNSIMDIVKESPKELHINRALENAVDFCELGFSAPEWIHFLNYS